ncbi:MAG: hypothetical protein JKY95_13545 [Planctomycetaceae bacterium]|nr:hypothetical protein [Planctomycetaceae bacterium]
MNEEQERLLRELAELDHVNVSEHRKSFWEQVKEFVHWDAEDAAEEKSVD